MAEDDLEEMTAVELRELALKEYPQITGVHTLKKEELLHLIHQARGDVIKEVKKKARVKVAVDKKELKKQIRQLKSEREKLLQTKDKKALAKIRGKIKKLKRLTQKAA